MDKRSANIFLIAILVLSAILRLIHPSQIPYTYDELSALTRTHYNSFSELVNKGIIIDGHPAGIQVFIYYWTKLFGYNELVVKLPFIAFGVLAVYFIYKVGQDWFNTTVGLVCAAYVATLQYPIMHSQVIRPYVSGLFLAMAMVYYWNKVIFKPENSFYKNLSLYVLFSALCAYDHHFCLLFAAIVGFTGLFFVRKQIVLKYIFAGIAIFVLYIPHLHIFFYQLNKGGVGGPNGWLGAPRYTFILDYIFYVFNFSRSIVAVGTALVLFGIYNAIRKGFTHKKYFFISLAWFILPLLTGFLYSIYVNPVLQFSVLIFSFPFLLFCFFGWVPELPVKYTAIILVIICSVNTYSLVKVRKHYQLFYKAPYEQSIILNDSLVNALGKGKYACVIQSDDSDKNVSNYYIHKNHADTSFRWTDSFGCFVTHPSNYIRFIQFMEKQHTQYFAYGCTAQFDPIVLHIITGYYPYLVKKWDFAGASFFLLTNTKTTGGPALYSFESLNNFEGTKEYWAKVDTNQLCDTLYYSPKHSCKMDWSHEWASDFNCKLSNVSWNKNDVIEVSLEVYPLDTLNDVKIVSALESNGKTIEWRATPVTSFIVDTLRQKWIKVYHTMKLQDMNINYPNMQLKVYIWNRGRKKFYIDDFSVKVLKGNPVIYGLFEKI